MKPQSSVEGRRALEVVVCLEDSILDVIHLRTAGQVRAGHDKGCQVVLPAEALGGAGSLVLASLDASGQAYAARALDASGAMRPIDEAENVSLETGKLRVFVRSVPDTQTATRGTWGLDRHAAKVGAVTLVGHLAFLWMILAIPPEAKAIAWLDAYRNDRLIKVRSKPTEDELLKQQKADAPGENGAEAGAQAAAHTGPSGKMGTPDKTTKGATALKGTEKVDRPSAQNMRDWVSGRGVLGVMKATDMSPILAADEQFSGTQDKYASGSDNMPPGDGYGTIGSGYVGDGRGGCPPGAAYCSDGTIGSGRYKTIGIGPGGYDSGTGDGTNLRPRGKPDHELPTIGRAEIGADGLDKAIVKRYVRDRLQAIGYCYEKQLTVASNLGGTITVEFVIGPNGAVISARGDGTVGSKAADSCVVDQVRGIQFPKNDAMTNVRYPFTFHTSGQ